LIHGSSEGRLFFRTNAVTGVDAGLMHAIRFRVVWGAGKMTREEIEGVGFEWCDCSEMMQVKELLASHGVVDSLSFVKL
jgi:hypothetical protein